MGLPFSAFHSFYVSRRLATQLELELVRDEKVEPEFVEAGGEYALFYCLQSVVM